MEKKLIIIDGNLIINRVFYVFLEMNNKEGLKINVIYGFIIMLFKMIDIYKLIYISVVFDRKVFIFRYLEYKEYKVGRKGMLDELVE